MDLFVNEPPDEEDVSDQDEDSSSSEDDNVNDDGDSDSSQYSGLEEEVASSSLVGYYMSRVLRKLGIIQVRKVSSLCGLHRLIRNDTFRFYNIFSFK